MNKSKIFLSLGTATIVLSSLPLVVSCSQNEIQTYVDNNGKLFVETYNNRDKELKNVYASSIIDFQTFKNAFSAWPFELEKNYEIFFKYLNTNDNEGNLSAQFSYLVNNKDVYTPSPVPKKIIIDGKEEILKDENGKPIMINTNSTLFQENFFKKTTQEINNKFSTEFSKLKNLYLNKKGKDLLNNNFSDKAFNYLDKTQDNYIGKCFDVNLSGGFSISDFYLLSFSANEIQLKIVLEDSSHVKKGASFEKPEENIISISFK